MLEPTYRKRANETERSDTGRMELEFDASEIRAVVVDLGEGSFRASHQTGPDQAWT